MASAKSQQGGVIFDLSEVSFPMLSRGEGGPKKNYNPRMEVQHALQPA
jgi:hypothetical protein